MKLFWQTVRFNLKETFAISYGNYTSREALIISLEQFGLKGFGECTGIDYYNINLSDFDRILNTVKSQIENQKIIYPTEFYAFLLHLNLPSFLRSALDCAYWDLFGKLEKRSFTQLNAIDCSHLPDSSITVSAAPIAEQIQKIKQSDWPRFKVKLNGFDEKTIITLLETERSIALDSNGSFTAENCHWLENYPDVARLDYLEQPMKPGIENFPLLHADKYANWMADEDCQDSNDLESLLPHYRSVNIKLVKCGGLTPALEMISTARKFDFKIMIGCMTESTIGISAGASLAPLCDFADLDGANLIANDIAVGSYVENGRILLKDEFGLGIQLK